MRSMSWILYVLLVGCRSDGEVPQGVDTAASQTEPSTLEFTRSGPVTVQYDESGVPHVTATSSADAFWAQGYVTARDRMWHMDYHRRRARGQLSEILGEEHLDGDIMMRALSFGRWADETAVALRESDPEIALYIDAYTAGVNQYLDDALAGRHGLSLSPQIQALDYTPAPWTPSDSLAVENLITGGLSMRVDVDLIIGLLHSTFSPEFFADQYRYQGMETTAIVPDFYAGKQASMVEDDSEATTGRPRLDRAEAIELARVGRQLFMGNNGSNSFVVSGTQTVSGNTLIANDAHFDTEHPTLFYFIHLDTSASGGELNAVGASVPGTPFVLFGHNESASWVPTNGFQDASDLYLEAFVPGAIRDDGVQLPDRVMFEGELVEIDRRTETFAVREPGAPADSTITHERDLHVVPHHGPILPLDALGLPVGVKLSVRWTGGGAVSVMRGYHDMSIATDWETFRDAADLFYTGGNNWLFADDQDNIGYTSFAHLPIREPIDPAYPPVTWLPGDGDYEWLADPSQPMGFAIKSRDEVPWVYNPERGWIVTANNDSSGTLADNDPANDPVYMAGMFDMGTRAFQASRRIEQAIGASAMDFDEAIDIQLDTVSRPAERLLPYLFEAAERDPERVTERMRQALNLLEAWDARCEMDGVEATLFHGWMIVFLRDWLIDEEDGLFGELLLVDSPAFTGQFLGKNAAHFLDLTAADIDAIEAGELPYPSLTGLDFFDDTRTTEIETRDDLLLKSLDDSLDELAVMLGNLGADPDDMTTWTWGVAHTVRLDDPAAVVLPESSSERLPMSGGLYTFQVAEFDMLHDGQLPERFDTVNLSSNRFVIELEPGAIRGMAILPGGQAEQPGSPNFNDQLQEFTDGSYRPLRFYPDDVAEGLVETWTFAMDYAESGELTVE